MVVKVLGMELIVPGHCVQAEEKLREKYRAHKAYGISRE